MKQSDVLALLRRYEENACTAEEEKLLMQWFTEQSEGREWTWESEEARSRVRDLMYSRLDRALFVPKWYQRKSVLRPMAAACVLILCGVLAWTYLSSHAEDRYEQFYTREAVEPGSSAALLTLADGSTIRLDEADNGLLSNKNGVMIKKMDNGELVYEVDESIPLDKDGNIAKNTISIPRGGKYQLTLPDGSKVWLNSGSTLIYPAVFVGDTRTVTLMGEAYFEVAHNTQQPFIVKALDNEITVTGTHFNVSAYRDAREIKTTLVEGGVVVTKNNTRLTLAPGQQAISPFESNEIQKLDVDPFYALAWIKGYFVFEDQDIKAIMNEVARWYNVEIQYEGRGNVKKIGGTYLRSKGLDELLNHLETLSGARFRLAERRVIVTM